MRRRRRRSTGTGPACAAMAALVLVRQYLVSLCEFSPPRRRSPLGRLTVEVQSRPKEREDVDHYAVCRRRHSGRIVGGLTAPSPVRGSSVVSTDVSTTASRQTGGSAGSHSRVCGPTIDP
jgi:hypothetical protein